VITHSIFQQHAQAIKGSTFIMSKLWTPGGSNPEQSSGGIELPKGFSRKRESAEQAPASEASTDPTAAPAPAQAPQGGRRQSNLLFPPSGVQIQCPNCNTPFQAAVFSIIDLGVNPELRQPLLGGQVNMASCPACGAGGALSAPLMIHDPEHKFLGVLIPQQSQISDLQAQKVIGEMSQALINQLPTEQRKGYMLQPRQFFDWESLLEKLWEFEGVSPEELRRQREQGELINSLIRLSDDEAAMKMVVERRIELVDQDFLLTLSQLMQSLAQQGMEDRFENLRNLRQHLLDSTEAGAAMKALEDTLRTAVSRLKPEMSRDQFLDVVLDYWEPDGQGERIVGSLLAMAQGLVDYQLLMTLAGRIDQASDPEERSALMALREMIVEINDYQSQNQQAVLQRAQGLFQEVMQASDTEAKLREHADQIDEIFLSLLASNLQQAEKSGATFAVKRLRKIYDMAINILQEHMPEDMQLLNQLLMAPDEASAYNLLKEKRHLLSKDFVAALQELESRARSDGNQPMADRIKQVRARVTLML
jgi:hypothetical protein